VFEESAATWSVARRLYGGKGKIWERHRHRYEVNPEYVDRLVQSGLTFVGKDEKGERMQLFELRSGFFMGIFCFPLGLLMLPSPPAHPFFIGLQAHPEFCTRPLNPSPPFLGFVAAASGRQVFVDQLELQEKTFVPPHPTGTMVSEDELKNGTEAVPAPRHEEEAEQHMKVVQEVNKDL
jgi:CTP synthase